MIEVIEFAYHRKLVNLIVESIARRVRCTQMHLCMRKGDRKMHRDAT